MIDGSQMYVLELSDAKYCAGNFLSYFVPHLNASLINERDELRRGLRLS